MSLERIKTQLLEDANKEAEKLIGAAQNGLAMKLSREELLLKEGVKKRLEALNKELGEEKEKHLSVLKTSHNQQILKLKNDIIDRAFQEATDGILSLGKQEYLELLQGWLERLSIDEKAELKLSSKDLRGVGPELVRRINESRNKNGFSLATSAVNITGGFVLTMKGCEINRSLGGVVNHLREELISEVAEKLFGKQ